MLKIRLQRTGRTNCPFWRIVVIEVGRSRQGRFVEILGHFNPRDKQKSLTVKADRIKHWIAQGAQVSAVVNNLLIAQGTLAGAKRKVTRTRRQPAAEPEAKAKPERPAAEAKPMEAQAEKSAESAKITPEEPAAEAEPAESST